MSEHGHDVVAEKKQPLIWELPAAYCLCGARFSASNYMRAHEKLTEHVVSAVLVPAKDKT
jgi:hypothetical protein